MAKKFKTLSLFALACGFAAALWFAPVTGGQSQRGQCQQDCQKRYDACRRAAGADNDACRESFDTCREGCREVRGNNGNSGMSGGSGGRGGGKKGARP